MHKFLNLLFEGGITQKDKKQIQMDILESNRENLVLYSLVSFIGFILISIYAKSSDNTITRNFYIYLICSIVTFIIFVANRTIGKNNKFVVQVSQYFFTAFILCFGIALAVTSKEDLSASYMVYLFVVPLLFISRPIIMDSIIIVVDISYIIIMHAIQEPELFEGNMINAIAFGILSIIVCTTMSKSRVQKFETEHVNRILMETDQLTGMLNRRSFEQHMDRLRKEGSREGVMICAFDVNGLKKVNDNIGHHAGDELLKGAASCIESVFSSYGYCYRVGGDEFIAILQKSSPDKDELLSRLHQKTTSFKGEFVNSLTISTGIVVGEANDDVDELLRKADARMYAAKAEFYRVNGVDRRRSRD